MLFNGIFNDLFQAFDNFVGKKFMTLKRYSGEGAESMIAFMSEAFESCATRTLSFHLA